MKLTIPKYDIEIEGTVDEVKAILASLLRKGNEPTKATTPKVVSGKKRRKSTSYGERGTCYICKAPARNGMSNVCNNPACTVELKRTYALNDKTTPKKKNFDLPF